jgi:hypothetical protein
MEAGDSDSSTQLAESPFAAFDLETPTPDASFPPPGGVEESPAYGDARPAPRGAVPEPAAAGGRTNSLLKIYASAITVLCMYLVLQLVRNSRPEQLESLPDIPPLKENESQFYPIEARLPDGHVLSLGESRRFGNILVEPLRVTYGPLEYEHWTGQSSRTRPPSDESVVKLWVRFTNVSEDQQIAPFDGELVLRQRYHENEMRTNNFLRRAGGEVIEFMYQMPPASEWELSEQRIGHVLEPGESFETYAATGSEHLAEVLGNLDGESHDLVWRLHLRKGYGPAGNGVTTLVDVAFKSSAISREDHVAAN